MDQLIYLFSDPVIAGVAIVVLAGAAFARFSGSMPLAKRVRILRGVWIAAFLALGMWGMQQEKKVQAGAAAPGIDAPAAVTVDGQTYYVSDAQAFRHAAVLWVILGAGLTFALVEMLVLRRPPPE